MAKLDPVKMAKGRALKRLRQKVRVEMAIRADEVLNFLEPELTDQIDARAALEQPYEVDADETWVRDIVDKYYPRRGAVMEIVFPGPAELEAGE